MFLSRAFLAVLFAFSFPGTGRAQLADWVSIPAAGSMQLEQSLAVVTEGNSVHAFSCITRTWATITGSFGGLTRTLLNEHLIVQDGPVFWGYSPRAGAFAPRYVQSATPVLLPAGSPQTWHSIVVDGNFLHVFFALTGQWATYAFASPPTVTMGRFCFLVSEGGTVYGVSSYYGSLVPLLVGGATATRAEGNVGLALSAGAVHGFSASRNRWATLPVNGTPALSFGNAQPAFAAIQDNSAIALFSGHTGTFTTLPATTAATTRLERYVALVVEAGTAYGYSALTGTFATLALAATPTVTLQQMFALVDDGTQLSAFSAATGDFAAPVPSAGIQFATRAQIATATAGSATVPFLVYSSFRNRWDSVPAGLQSPTAYLTAASVVLVDGGGAYGWSQRGAGWVYEPTGTIDAVVVGSNPPNTAETIFLRGTGRLFTFNARTQAWRSVQTSGTATLVRAHYLAILAQDGSNAYAFSTWNDRWSVQPLQAAWAGGTAQVQSAWATDGIRTYAFAGVGQLSLVGEYPDFYRAATQGAPLRIDVAGEPGAPMILAVSTGPANIPLPPLGTLLLDPLRLSLWLQATMPAAGTLGLTLQVPEGAGIRGSEIHFQALVVAPTSIYLTNSVFPTFF